MTLFQTRVHGKVKSDTTTEDTQDHWESIDWKIINQCCTAYFNICPVVDLACPTLESSILQEIRTCFTPCNKSEISHDKQTMRKRKRKWPFLKLQQCNIYHWHNYLSQLNQHSWSLSITSENEINVRKETL